MELPSQMVLFAQVVEANSFSAAARAMGQSPSAVSRQIGHLEDRLGVRLLNRSKHGLALTEEGREFYKRCVELSDQISEAEHFAESMVDHPKGRLKIASTVAFGKSQLLPVLPAFQARFPDISLSLELTDRKIDMAEESIDLAIRFTEQLDDAAVIARKLAKNRRVICAAPQYLKSAGVPKDLVELERHNCLRITTVSDWNNWQLEQASGGQQISIGGNFEANSADGIYHAVLAGMGIARLSTYLVSKDIGSGRLVRLFPDYEDNGSDIVAIYVQKRNLPPKVRVLIDYLVECFGDVPPWERAA